MSRRRTAGIVGVVVMGVVMLAVLSVLLGITAEPETFIEGLFEWAAAFGERIAP